MQAQTEQLEHSRDPPLRTPPWSLVQPSVRLLALLDREAAAGRLVADLALALGALDLPRARGATPSFHRAALHGTTGVFHTAQEWQYCPGLPHLELLQDVCRVAGRHRERRERDSRLEAAPGGGLDAAAVLRSRAGRQSPAADSEQSSQN